MTGAQLIPLGAGLLAAALFLSGNFGVPLMAFTQIPLAAVGLALGFMSLLTSFAVATFAIGVLALGLGILSRFVIFFGAPVLLAVYLALQSREAPDGSREWYPVGHILSVLTAVAAFAVVAVGGYFAAEGDLRGALLSYVEPMTPALSALLKGDEALAGHVLAGFAPYLPASLATSWLFLVVLNTVVPQRALASAGRSIRPNPDFRTVTLNRWPGVILAAGVLASFAGGDIGLVGVNLAVVALVPFFFIGLAVLHSISAAWPGRPLILAGVYLLLVLVLWFAVLMAAIGVAEHWLHLRRRMSGGQPPRNAGGGPPPNKGNV